MCFPDLFKPKHHGGLCLVRAGCRSIDYCLKRNIAEREFRRTEHKTAEKAKVHAARHLEQRTEGWDWFKTTQKPGQADASAASHHRERVQNRTVSHQFQNGVDTSWKRFADAPFEVWSFQVDSVRPQSLQYRTAIAVPISER